MKFEYYSSEDMSSYKLINLKIMIEEIGEVKAQQALSDFSCEINRDVESFLLEKAIAFAKQNVSQTHIVMAPYNDNMVIAGYFALANKNIKVSEEKISKSLFKRIRKFGNYDPVLKVCEVPALLIGQIGKNYKYNDGMLIAGHELLKIACDKLALVQDIIGGKLIYLECEDNHKLKNFYESNGFCLFGERKNELFNRSELHTEYLLQYLKYM